MTKIIDMTEALKKKLVEDKLNNAEVDKAAEWTPIQALDYARDLILHVKENGGIKFREFAPFITEEEEEGEYPSQKTKKRAERVENRLRALIFYKMSETHGTKWKGKLPPSVNIYIDEAMQSRRAMGHDYEDPPTIEVLNEITTYHILIILKAQKNHKIDFFLTKDGVGVFQVRDAEFTTRWRDFSNLRNLIAHHNSYPSEEMKSLMKGALGLMEKWLDAAEGN